MIRPWLLAAFFAGYCVPFAFAQTGNEVPKPATEEEGPGFIPTWVPNEAAAQFFAQEKITWRSRVGALRVFKSLLAADKNDFDATIGRVTSPEEFEGLVARAKALNARYVGEEEPAKGPGPSRSSASCCPYGPPPAKGPGPHGRHSDRPYGPPPANAPFGPKGVSIGIADKARLDGVVGKAAAEAAGWTPSLRLQAGLTQGDDGNSAFGGGGMLRFGYGTEKAGTIGFQGGAILSGAGGQNKLLDRHLVDEARYYERPYEVWEETRRHVSGLSKVRFAGVSYVSPAIGGVVELEGGVDLAYAHLNTAPEVVRETYINELVRRCYDGDCRREWETRNLSREVLHVGQGQRQSGFGQTVYGAANIKFGKDSDVAARVEVGKDRFKAFPEASGMSYSGGLVLNLDGLFGLLRGEP